MITEITAVASKEGDLCMPEDAKPRPPSQRTLGEIEGYELRSMIGKGGMGAVYLATQVSMDRDVALKVLLPALAKDRDFVARFVREARAAGKLQHVNIVRGIDVGESKGYYYFAMEYIEGATVSGILKQRGKIPEANALGITLHIARALEHAWNHQIVHRDVKPSNILIAKDGTAKLMDLGLAKSTREDIAVTVTGVALGTPHYISPEQARGERDLDTRADIYSLGATLYHMVTGVVPFDGDTAAVVMTKHLTEQLPSPRSKNPDLSPGMCRLIEKMMAKDAADRYASPTELIQDISKVARGGVPVGVKPKREAAGDDERRKAAPVPRRFSSELFWGTVVVGVILIGIVAFLLVRSKEKSSSSERPPVVVERPDAAPKAAEAKEMFEYAKQWEKEHPDDYEGAARKYQLVSQRAPGTIWEMKALDAVEAIRSRAEKDMADEFQKIEKKALDLAAKGDYDGAIVAYGQVPAKYEKMLGAAARQAANRLRGEVEEKINAAGVVASQLAKEGQPEKALAELDKIAHIKYAPFASKVAGFRARLEAEKKDAVEIARKRAEAAAKKEFEVLWGTFDEKILAQNYTGAKVLLNTARADDVPESVRKGVDALQGLLGEFDAAKQAQTEAAKALSSLVGRDVVLETVKGEKKGKVKAVSDGVIQLRREYRINNQVGWSEEKVAVSDLTPEERSRLMPIPDPATARGWLARAIYHIGLEHAGEAEAAYEKAKEHSLAPHYGSRI
ncbi:serine/threonine-protein kinase, partial [Planctomycetota bacterium]